LTEGATDLVFTPIALAVALGISPFAVPAHADGAKRIDHHRIETCLATKDSPRDCLFAASGPCETQEVQRAASQLRARMWCDLRESDVWISLADEAFSDMVQRVPKQLLASLHAIRDSHLAGRTARCKFPYDFFRTPWSESDAARCLLHYEHEHASALIEAQTFLSDVN